MGRAGSKLVQMHFKSKDALSVPHTWLHPPSAFKAPTKSKHKNNMILGQKLNQLIVIIIISYH